MRRWHEEHDRSGSEYEGRDSLRSRDDRRHDDYSHRRDFSGRSEMSGRQDMNSRMDHERPMHQDHSIGRERYLDDSAQRGYGSDQRRESYGQQRYDQQRYDQQRYSQPERGRIDRDEMRYDTGRRDDSHRFLYDNERSDRPREHDPRRYQEPHRSEYTSRPRDTRESGDWDDRPRISGPVRLDPSDRRDSHERGYRESQGRMQGPDGRSRGEDFEQYRGRDAGFSWSDGSNSALSHDYDRWGNEYSNTSRREGIGWNRGSTRDPHFWSSPDRDR